MTEAGWYDDGSGRDRWWDGSAWTEQFRDAAGSAAAPAAAAPVRVFPGNGSGGSTSLSIYPGFVEFEHRNYVVAVPLAMLGPISYSKQQTSPFDSVTLTPDVKFHCDNPREVYEYVRGLLAGS
jgi:hypothetical protein